MAHAVLCLVDVRAPCGMVARVSTSHRSVWPSLTTARGTFVFTSHAGVPLCVWDRRKLNAPVFTSYMPFGSDHVDCVAEEWRAAQRRRALLFDGEPFDQGPRPPKVQTLV